MKAIIMAGGDGKRLRPITCTMPKPLVPVLNKPIVDYTMDLLRKHGITEAVYTLHYMGDAIREHIGNGSAWGIDVTYSSPGKKLGTAGSVRVAIGEANETILVMSGDGITDIDLSMAINAHRDSGADATIVLKKVAEPTEYGIVLKDDNDTIVRFIEKPERNEVFSDLANTGIYILEANALNMIPEDTDYDFSKDLFTKMLSQGMRLHGYTMKGYWCDVGDIAQYRQAQQDMLDGKCAFETIAKSYGGVYIEPNVNIASSAKLIAPCYIASGASVGEAVCIEPYAIIGSNTMIEDASSIKHSVVFENVRIRRNTEIRGCVICEEAHIDERSALFEGCTIGARTHIGANVTVMPNVSIWPDKDIEGGIRCRDNVMWGNSSKRISFDGSDITGYADNQLTPETALRIGAAIAAGVKLPARLAVCADGGQLSVMLKYAVASGIASQGVDVAFTDTMGKSAFAFSVASSGCSGGIYISENERRMAELKILDENGIESSGERVRSIRGSFTFGELQPSTAVELGIISKTSGMSDAYEHSLLGFVNRDMLAGVRKTLRIAAPSQVADSVSRILLELGWNVEAVKNSNRLVPSHDADTLAIAIDENGILSVAVGSDTIADHHSILALMAIEGVERHAIEQAVLPSSIAEAYRDAMKEAGVKLSFTAESIGKQKREAHKKNAYYAPLYEPEAAVIKLCELFARGELKRRIDSLPIQYCVQKNVRATWRDMGRMLRTLAEGEKNTENELIDGVRLKYDTGWVVVKPSGGTTAAFRVISGSSDSEYAKELCDIYTDKLKTIRDSADSK